MSFSNPTRDQVKLHYGVIFQHLKSTGATGDAWLHTFILQTPESFNLSVPDASCDKSLSMTPKLQSTCLLFQPLISEMQQLQTTLKSELKQIVTYIHDILPQFPPEAGQATRQTRAVLPFLGTALNWLAGVALDDDIAAMRGHMSTIKKQQIILMDILQKQNDDLSSYIHAYCQQPTRHSFKIISRNQ